MQEGGGGGGFRLDAELRLTVETMDAMFYENIAQRKKVNDEQEGPQDRALGHSTADWGGLGLVENQSFCCLYQQKSDSCDMVSISVVYISLTITWINKKFNKHL